MIVINLMQRKRTTHTTFADDGDDDDDEGGRGQTAGGRTSASVRRRGREVHGLIGQPTMVVGGGGDGVRLH